MRKVRARTRTNIYDIFIGSDLHVSIGEWLLRLGVKHKAVILSNPIIDNLYGDNIRDSLSRANFKSNTIMVPDGEEYKSLKTAAEIYSQLAQAGVERNTPLIALGGGIIGDLTGFVAATYMRGLPLLQVPTSLLAQVDSSIGGKTAVNHESIKNKIGSFYQPALVISDISCLRTLPETELVNGLAEVIKYAVIGDKKFFSYLEASIERIRERESGVLEDIVFKCTRIKAGIVTQDERDLGLRNILNFGHTVGHALESISEFKLAHGAAVALGMLAAGKIASRLGLFSEVELRRLKQLIANAGLPVTLPLLDIGKVMATMQQDKKVKDGRLRFILPQRIGRVQITDEVEPALLEEVLTQYD